MSIGARLLLDGNIHIYLDVASTTMRAAVKPRIDGWLIKKKSRKYFVPTGSSVESDGGPLANFWRPARVHIGHEPGIGASLHGRPGPVMMPLFTMSWRVAIDLWPYIWCNHIENNGEPTTLLLVIDAGCSDTCRYWSFLFVSFVGLWIFKWMKSMSCFVVVGMVQDLPSLRVILRDTWVSFLYFSIT